MFSFNCSFVPNGTTFEWRVPVLGEEGYSYESCAIVSYSTVLHCHCICNVVWLTGRWGSARLATGTVEGYKDMNYMELHLGLPIKASPGAYQTTQVLQSRFECPPITRRGVHSTLVQTH